MSYTRKGVRQYRLDRHTVSDASCRWCKGMKDSAGGSMYCPDPGKAGMTVRKSGAASICEKYDDTRLNYANSLRAARAVRAIFV